MTSSPGESAAQVVLLVNDLNAPELFRDKILNTKISVDHET